ncbi:MAG: GNAT family N-acetyltransferase [Planctomycetes bacterium]|nr:GNAT family N-acetyltransferase [Planctomycetota bacterium]
MNGPKIEPLSKSHDRAGFQCGVAALDRYLLTKAGQDVKRNATQCCVLSDDGVRVRGYYTLSAASVVLSDVPLAQSRRLARYPEAPAILFGRLAISESEHGRGAGGFLLMDALKRSLDVSSVLGASLVVVDAKDEQAAAFYLHYGFVRLENPASRLVMAVATIAKLFE